MKGFFAGLFFGFVAASFCALGLSLVAAFFVGDAAGPIGLAGAGVCLVVCTVVGTVRGHRGLPLT